MRASEICFVLLIGCCGGCKPKVFSFTATPRIVSSKDSVHLDWRTRGKAGMYYYQERVAHPPGDSADILDFVLTSRKWGKTSAPFTQQVELVAGVSRDVLSLALTGRDGDSLVAKGIKDTVLYRGFEIISLTALSHRAITATHDGVTAVLPDSGIIVTTLRGVPYDGEWTLKTALTPEEKIDKTAIPNTLGLFATIKPIKH